jgi:hypothetical protein
VHFDDPESHTLADCKEVHRRRQHQSRNALDKYVLGAIGKMKEDAPTESVTTDEVPDTTEDVTTDDTESEEDMEETSYSVSRYLITEMIKDPELL